MSAQDLIPGANLPMPAALVVGELSWQLADALSLCCCLLGVDGKIRDVADLIGPGRPESSGGEVRLTAMSAGQATFEINVPALPPQGIEYRDADDNLHHVGVQPRQVESYAFLVLSRDRTAGPHHRPVAGAGIVVKDDAVGICHLPGAIQQKCDEVEVGGYPPVAAAGPDLDRPEVHACIPLVDINAHRCLVAAAAIGAATQNKERASFVAQGNRSESGLARLHGAALFCSSCCQ